MEEKRESVFALALNCSKRRLPPAQFVNFYNELVNEQYGAIINNAEDTEPGIHVDVYGELSQCLLKILEAQSNPLLADYVTEVLFVNYNTELAHRVFPQLYTIQDISHLAVLLSKASAFFLHLNDKLLIDQICGDLGSLIMPSLFATDFSNQSELLVVAMAKFMRNIAHLSSQTISIIDPKVKENLNVFLARLSKTNRLLYRKIVIDFESTIKIDGSSPISAHDQSPNNFASPSAVSPKYTGLPSASLKASHPVVTSKFQASKLVRYCKNLWLNNRILNWFTNARDFVSDYGVIEAAVLKDSRTAPANVETVMVDLIETSFTSFAQFVSNKHYHQPNSDFNLLERKWTIFIAKQLPLYVLEHIPKNPDLVITAMEKIDHKVIKVLKSCASDKDDSKNGGNDLFEDLPNKNMDIRHEFLKNLIILGCQPASVLNDYLREDQIVDTKSLPSNDIVVIRNTQGVKESINDFPRFIKEKVQDLDLESMFDMTENPTSNIDSDIIQVLRKFDSLAATRQRELSEVFHEIFCESARNFDCKTFSKICCLMSFNLSHSLTAIFAFITPATFLAVATEFVDETWERHMKQLSQRMSDDFEPNTEFVCFTYAIILIINITKTFDVSLVESMPANSKLSSESFTVKFLSDLGNIPPALKLESSNQSTEVLESWVRDLFINGSLSDSLMKNADAKDVSRVIPFLFKQSVLSVEAGIVRDVSTLTGGFEYFLQPFLIVGLIGVVFWTEQYLTALKTKDVSKELLDLIFEMLSSVLNPSTFNDESKPLHTLILRLNAVHLLKAARAFRTQSSSNYGIYSSDSGGDPKLESIISHLELVCSTGNFYNVDPTCLASESQNYPRKELTWSPFSITAESSMNGILMNQINSFWNMHSSTYYNLDYLFTFIDIMTPLRFFEASLFALRSKAFESASSDRQLKDANGEASASLDYFFHFLVTYDLKKASLKTDLLNYMTTSQEVECNVKKSIPESNINAKIEQHSDEDFEMLFGEDTSVPGNETDITIYDSRTDEEKSDSKTNCLLKPSFAAVLHSLLSDKRSLFEMKHASKEEFEETKHLHEKYVEILRSEAV
ncbi:LAME_0G12024g1_1 [Lachancea meyersii CBS 8951]|uniref:Mediator of RNA polymerase II transcription subunit 5 n=1 Tax=Lachancea meyersii CBS 8951 TaxID=1266667 RepID=A0A1G4K9Q5_9SACH|nr:LAME_0G12024g1_1 [Lachancea meyersii CBS 8951]